MKFYAILATHSNRSCKVLLIMKLIIALMIVGFVQVRAKTFAQLVTINEKNAKIEYILDKIRLQTGYNILCDAQILESIAPLSISIKNVPLNHALEKCLAANNLAYSIVEDNIVIRQKEEQQGQKDLKGKVTDRGGSPLFGVTIKVKGANRAVTSNKEGNFSIRAASGDILVFTSIGYLAREVVVADFEPITIQLEEDQQSLSEVVVVSYGTQTKKAIVGAVASLNASDMKDQPAGTFAEKLQGKLPGVQLAQATGRPGQGMNFRIRGAASIGARNEPLVVVDGIPLLGVTDNLNNINPDEIETFTVLKDASATALYGSRAANGVIIITTKRGKLGQTQVNFNAYVGLANGMKNLKPEVMNGTELATYMKGFYEDKIKYEGYKGGIPEQYQNPQQYGEGTDWYSLLLRTGRIENYSLNIATGNEKSALSMVAGYLNQEGIVKNTGYKRFSLRLNGDLNLTENIKLGANISPSIQLEHNNRQGDGFNVDGQRAIFASSLMVPSMGSPYNEDGSLALGVTGFPGLFPWANPLRQLLEADDNATRPRVLANVFGEFGFLKNFTFKTSINADLSFFSRKKFIPSTAVGGFNNVPIDNAPPGDKSAIGESNFNNSYNWLTENTLNWDQTFGVHHVRALVGFSAQKFNDYRNNITGRDFPDNSIPYLTAATRFTKNESTSTAWALVSFFSRFNYDYKGKYLLEVSMRRDGSSRFGKDNRYGTFPAIGGGWVVSEEPFFKGITLFNYLKIRASYGVTGNFEIGDYTAIDLIDNSNYVLGSTLAPGKVQSTLGNPSLSWEKNKQFNIGLDIGLLKDRLSFSYDYYNKLTEGLLYPVAVPRSSGFTTIQDNVGDIKFWGHEFTISSKNLTGAFKWNTDFNLSIPKNVVQRLGITNAPIADNPTTALSDFSDWRTEVGKPLGMFYGYVSDGVFMNQAEFDAGPKIYNASGVLLSRVGTVRFKDLNGDGKVTPEDKTFIGNPNPDFIFGLTNTFGYKNFDLSVSISGTYGNKIKNGMDESLYNLDGAFNGPKELLNRWRSEEEPGNGRIQRTLAGFTALARADNDMFIYDGSHITVNNISLGYTFGKFNNAPVIKNMRVYSSVQNAFIITKYKGNPEVSSGGLNGVSQGQDFGAYPVARTFSFGVNVNF